MIIAYSDMRERCGIEPEVVRLWVRKGYLPGTDEGVERNDLDAFLSDIGPYALGWMPTGRSLAVGYRCFVGLWPQVVGADMAEVLRRLDKGVNLATLAEERGLSVPALQYRIRKATRLLKSFFSQLPQPRLQTEVSATPTVGEATAVASGAAEDALWERLRAPLNAWELSAKCVHAAERAGISSLGDFLIVNQACGRAGMLRKIAHFGKGAYDEVQRLLLKEGLIQEEEGEFWHLTRPEWVDIQSSLYHRYKSEKSEHAENKDNSWVKQSLIWRSKLGK